MKRRQFAIIAAVLTLTGALLTGSVYAAEEEIHETFNLKDGESVSVQNTNGSIEVSVWNKDYVDVIATKKTNKRRSELDKIEVIFSTRDGLSIETEYLERRVNASVSYEIKLPKNIKLRKARSTNGSVEVYGTAGDSEISSTNGRVEAEKTTGMIDVQTTNGSITLNDIAAIRRVKTTNGSLEVMLTDAPKENIDVTTTNGSIRLSLPGDLDANLELNTTNGKINASGFRMIVDEVSKHRIKGVLGNGGILIYARTTNGNVTLSKN